MVLGLWISLRLSRKILDGIDLLSLGTARIEKGDFSHLIPVQSQDELGKLAVSFNEMAASLLKTVQERNVARDDVLQRARQLSDAQSVARLGSWEWEIVANRIQWSDELYRILGLNPKKTSPSSEEFMSRVLPDDHEKLTAAVNESVEYGTPFNCEFQVIRESDSEIRDLHSQGKVMEDSSGVRRLVGTLQDITEQRRMHSQLMQAGKMASLGEMAGGIAHEINSPLAIIKGSCAMMEELATAEKLDRVLLKQMVMTIESTTDRIAKIVHGLRVFSRDGSNEPFEKVTVRQLMDNTLILCKTRFKSQMIELICDEYSPTLSFDGRMIELSQVLLNLLNNASDAIEREPRKWIRISFQELGKFLEIRVIDCGKGIPEHHRKKLFQPFFTTKEFGKGTGLGLSLSMRIIKNHGGELKVDPSSPNTCFVIRLPLRQQKDSSSPLPSAV